MPFFIYRLRLWWRRVRNPPIVEIWHAGQATPRPQVLVSVRGMYGSQTVYTWDANDQGEACATMYGKGLADIMQRRLVDRRDPKWPRAELCPHEMGRVVVR